ncbi:hypothetical protein FXO37_21585 [Capsicum annuum]|nr:hypothetical protein FXO37_21585 [Capsicum annuum]
MERATEVRMPEIPQDHLNPPEPPDKNENQMAIDSTNKTSYKDMVKENNHTSTDYSFSCHTGSKQEQPKDTNGLIRLSTKDKQQIYGLWRFSVIIKAIGPSVSTPKTSGSEEGKAPPRMLNPDQGRPNYQSVQSSKWAKTKYSQHTNKGKDLVSPNPKPNSKAHSKGTREHMDDSPYEPYQSTKSNPSNSRLDECRNKCDESDSTLLSYQKEEDAGTEASFSECLWGGTDRANIYTSLNPPLNWEWDKTLEALREGNVELERILQTLKVPRIKAITLERPVHLTFKEVTREIVILLIPKEINNLDLKIITPSHATGSYYKTKISPLSRKRKRQDFVMRRGKKILIDI